MALMLGRLYDALRAVNVPDDKARDAAEEVANYEGESGKLRFEMSNMRLELGERFREMGERLSQVEGDVRPLKWMMGFVLAFQVANFFLQLR